MPYPSPMNNKRQAAAAFALINAASVPAMSIIVRQTFSAHRGKLSVTGKTRTRFGVELAAGLEDASRVCGR